MNLTERMNECFDKAVVLQASGEVEEAIAPATEAVTHARALRSEKLPDALDLLSSLECSMGDYASATRNASEALALLGDADSPHRRRIAFSAAQAFWLSGEAPRALQLLSDVVRAAEKDQDPNLPAILHAMGTFATNDEPQRAIEYFERALQICGNATPDDYHGAWLGFRAKALAGLGGVYARIGDREKAEDTLHHAERAFNNYFGPDDPETKALRKEIAEYLASR